MSAISLSRTFIEECKAAEKFIKNSTQSKPGYDACMQPFMMKNKDHNGKIEVHTTTVVNKLKNIPLPYKLNILFTTIGRVDIETYYNNWILLSLDKIEEMYLNYIKNNQPRSVNFAMFYVGMGNVCMVSYDPISEKIYYKIENGPNGYEAKHNFDKARCYVPVEKDLYDIAHWYDLIEKKEINISDIPLYSA